MSDWTDAEDKLAHELNFRGFEMTQDGYEVGSLENAEKFAIIRMAREAGFEVDEGLFPFEAAEDKYIGTERTLERFAALVAAREKKFWMEQIEVECNEAVLAEREACAKVCETDELCCKCGDECAAAIRARGGNGS